MSSARRLPPLGAMIFLAMSGAAAIYFTFAAVQGDFGLFRRVQLSAEADALAAERDRLAEDVALMGNLTRRLSDDFLDIDLLDERAREVLGYLRADEIVIR